MVEFEAYSGVTRPHADMPRLRSRIRVHGGRARVLRTARLRARADPLPGLPPSAQARPLRRFRRAHDARRDLLAVRRGDASAVRAAAGQTGLLPGLLQDDRGAADAGVSVGRMNST